MKAFSTAKIRILAVLIMVFLIMCPVFGMGRIALAADQYTVSFDGNGSSGSMEAVTVDYGSTFKLPENGFFIVNRMLAYWEVRIGNNKPVNKLPGDTIVVTADTTAKVVWKDAATIAVGLSAPGSISPSDVVESVLINGDDSGTVLVMEPGRDATIVVTPKHGYAVTRMYCNTYYEHEPVIEVSENGVGRVFLQDVPVETFFVHAVLSETVDASFDLNGGESGAQWPEGGIITKLKGAKESVSVVRNGDDSGVVLIGDEIITSASMATHVFDGIEINGVRYADGSVIDEFAFDGAKTIKFLWRSRDPLLRLHFSAIDGVDLVDPIVIRDIAPGTTVEEALAARGRTISDKTFEVPGYQDMGFRVPKPITEYSGNMALWAGSIPAAAKITEDMDIYYSMYKEITDIEVNIGAPICGSETTGSPGAAAWADQQNAPVVSVPEGVMYAPAEEEGKLAGIWVDGKGKPYIGSFETGQKYLAEVWLAANHGYTFAAKGVRVNGATLVEKYDSGDSCGVLVMVTADHDWGEWTVVKGATKTTAGSETRSCKNCGQTQNRVIPALDPNDLPEVYKITDGNRSVWISDEDPGLTFVFRRIERDEEAFSHFSGILIDGTEVERSAYSVRPGSVVIDLPASYLRNLSSGVYTLTAIFDDGADVPVLFGIAEETGRNTPPSSPPPSTGDSGVLVWAGLFAASAVSAAMALLRRRKQL